MMEEFHPTKVHFSGIENDSADAISSLSMKQKWQDKIKWEPQSERLRYSNYDNADATNSKPRAERKIKTQFMIITKALVELNFEPGDTEELLPVATGSQSEFEDLYPLNVKCMRKDQEKYEELQ